MPNMEVALTCARVAAHEQFPTTKCQFRAHPGGRNNRKTTFQAGMCMKTNDTVRSPRSEVRSRRPPAAGAPILTPGSLLLTPVLQEMKVHPEMLMKTKDRQNRLAERGSEIGGPKPQDAEWAMRAGDTK